MPVFKLTSSDHQVSVAKAPETVCMVTIDDLARGPEGMSVITGPIGLEIATDCDLDAIAPYIDQLALVIIRFEAFKDGRGFSTARLLRDRYGFLGDIRAAGNLLLDQIQFLIRVGFSSVEFDGAVDEDGIKAAIERFSVVYQTAFDSRRPIQRLRQSATPSPGP